MTCRRAALGERGNDLPTQHHTGDLLAELPEQVGDLRMPEVLCSCEGRSAELLRDTYLAWQDPHQAVAALCQALHVQHHVLHVLTSAFATASSTGQDYAAIRCEYLEAVRTYRLLVALLRQAIQQQQRWMRSLLLEHRSDEFFSGGRPSPSPVESSEVPGSRCW